MDIAQLHKSFKSEGIIFLTYGGFLSQSLIAAMTENLEHEAANNALSMRLSTNIFTIFIELSQNMMKYTAENTPQSPLSEALILVGKDQQGCYFITSRNFILNADAQYLDPRLEKLVHMDKDTVKKQYRELRRSGKDMHNKGAGIGFYEIAKCSTRVEYQLEPVDADRSCFIFTAYVGGK